VYTDIATGGEFGLALRSDGQVVGLGNFGSLPYYAPPALPSGMTYVGIAAGQEHAIALRSDGTAVAWGETTTERAPFLLCR